MPAPDVRRGIQERLDDLYRHHLEEDGEVAHYYASDRGYFPPEPDQLERPGPFAVSLASVDGDVFHAGDHEHRFALQSLSKVFVYGLALEDQGRDRVLERVGVEPSGDAFNSIVFDERNRRPYNPMVNAGALVTTDLVSGDGFDERWARILAMLRRCSGNDSLDFDETVFRHELEGPTETAPRPT